MSAAVVVLGSANMDLVVRQSRWVHPGETMFGASFTMSVGGKGLNQAVACARAGATVAFVGAVGSDGFGERLREAIVAEGIDDSQVRTTRDASGVAAITVTDDGENAIVVVAGANGVSDLEDAEVERIEESSFLVVQMERPVSLVSQAMSVARAAGVTTVLTPAPIVDGVENLVPLADILIPNEGEAIELSGSADAESAAARLSESAATVIVTLGERGCLIARDGEVVQRVRPRRVTAVDTTGAGDTFVGVLVAWLVEGAEPADAVVAATAAASLAVTRPGASAAMPFRAEIEAVLQ